jgi:hypothetical protein
MPSYRFCRPDDIPYLVRALNECFDVHFPHRPAMTVEHFRQEMKDLDVWPSNSMVASTNAGPIAVMIGTKRPHEVLVSRLGVHPEHRRQGHALHMLTSLSQKLAVLVPERLVVEAGRDLEGIETLLEAASYRFEAELVDHVRPAGPAEAVPGEWMVEPTAAELLAEDLLATPDAAPWERARRSLENRAETLSALAFASPERLEAALLFAPHPHRDALQILALSPPGDERRNLFLSLLVRHLALRHPNHALEVPRVHSEEGLDAFLATQGFTSTRRIGRWGARATPA